MVNGEAAVVVQDAVEYQALLDALAIERSASVIRQRVQQFAIDGIDEDAKDALENLRGDLVFGLFPPNKKNFEDGLWLDETQ